jgi:hypothetical protein
LRCKEIHRRKYSGSAFIDQVCLTQESRKINAILAAARNLEPLITITDADVLFKHNWQSGEGFGFPSESVW